MKECSRSGQAMRLGHLSRFLAEFDPTRGPVDLAWRSYAKRHPALGSKDRQWIAEKIYLHEKRRSLFIALAPSDWEERAHWLAAWPEVPEELMQELSRAEYLGLPEDLWNCLIEALGEELAEKIAEVSLTEAPLFLRTNAIKTDRESLIQELQAVEPAARPCEKAPFGIVLPSRTSVTQLPAYQAGHFEIQDEGSQLVAALCAAQPGHEVLDYCAGAGGKSLAIACGMGGKGQIFLHDIRERALAEAKLRLRRAGVQNAQVVQPNGKVLKALMNRCDWVIVDVPCSGTGTLRRNPDMKWRFCSKELEELIQLQREIVLKAMTYVKPKGRLVYSTCSILPQENQLQKQWIERQGWTCVQEWKSTPELGKMDGLYGAVFEKTAST